MTEYEKYQLNWLRDHDISLDRLIENMCDIADSEFAQPYESMNPSTWANAIRESFEILIDETGFAGGMCFVCEEEWEMEEKGEQTC